MILKDKILLYLLWSSVCLPWLFSQRSDPSENTVLIIIYLFYYDLIFNLTVFGFILNQLKAPLNVSADVLALLLWNDWNHLNMRCVSLRYGYLKKTLTDPDMKSDLSISFYRCNVVSVQTGSGFTHTYVSRHKQIWRDVICKSLILKVKFTFLLLFFFLL